jgi:hypothetical protein
MKKKLLIAFFIISTAVLQAQDVNKDAISKEVVRVLDSINKVKAAEEKAKPKKEVWYDKISIRGYAQVRYNGLLSSNDKVSCDHVISRGTTSTAEDANLTTDFLRRRVFSGQVHPNVYFTFSLILQVHLQQELIIFFK